MAAACGCCDVKGNVGNNYMQSDIIVRDGDGTFGFPEDVTDPEREAMLLHEIAQLRQEIDRLEKGKEAEARLSLVSSENLESVTKQPSRSSCLSLAPDAEGLEEVIKAASESEASFHDVGHHANFVVEPTANISVIMGSALSKSRALQTIIYVMAFGGVIFVFAAKTTGLGEHSEEGDGHRLLGIAPWARRLGSGPSDVLIHIAFCVTGAGVLAFVVNVLRLPLILGYLLGGLCVGPLCMDIVHNHGELRDLSSLGLVFLLFMIGLELDVSALSSLGRVVICTGLLQFPVCAFSMYVAFSGLASLGLPLGTGVYATLYCALSCSISSTMIVVKYLSEHADMDSSPGRLTVGILIFQDIWGIVVLAAQPDLSNLRFGGVCLTFLMIALLVAIALSYAKFVMPAVFMFSSESVELMLIVALAWCFFMCCLASLPFVNLSIELASLISGVALATFPYSAEFNGKIKYIRDFFITLFFVWLGMQIPTPTVEEVGKALLLAVVVLLIRWVGIFGVVMLLGGDHRLAMISTINLSQVSEFALVICSLGIKIGHLEQDTLTIIIWVFALLAVASSAMISHNYLIYGYLCRWARVLMGRQAQAAGDTRDDHEEGGDHVDRNIILLGFHKIAAMLIAHFEHHNPHLLAKLHVIDFHEGLMTQLKQRGVTCAYGDISSAEVLEHAHHGEARLVISSIPDSMLRGVTNLKLLELAKQVWPQADVIVTADNPTQAHVLYDSGADYVLRMAKLCAERLHMLITDHSTHAVHHHHVGEERTFDHMFASFKETDQEKVRHIHVH